MNAFSLDYGCHSYLGRSPKEHQSFIAARIGIEEIERLERVAKQPAYGIKRQLKAIAKHFRLEHDRMKLGGQFMAYESP